MLRWFDYVRAALRSRTPSTSTGAPLSAIIVTSCATAGNPFRLSNQNRIKDALKRGTLMAVSTVCMLVNRLHITM